MNTPPPDPYAKLSLGDRLELLAFYARLAGMPQPLLEALWEAIDGLSRHGGAADPEPAVNRQ